MVKRYSSILLILVVILLLIPLSLGCRGLSTSTPEATVHSLFAAYNDKDIDKMLSYYIPEERDYQLSWITFTFESYDSITMHNLHTSLQSVENDEAEVYAWWEWHILQDWMDEVVIEQNVDTIMLEKRDSEWLISDM